MQLWSLEGAFPGLRNIGYEITSEISDIYNCIAWAAGDDANWWSHAPDSYWPSDVDRSPGVSALVQVFGALGFSLCETDELETGFRKIAVNALSGEWTHVARQLGDGRWTSKVGQFEDISHPSLENLAGDAYGEVHCIMRRPDSEN